MAWRGGVPESVPALTVARICGSGAEAVAVGAEMIGAGLRHDTERPFTVVGEHAIPFLPIQLPRKTRRSGRTKIWPHRHMHCPRVRIFMMLMSVYDPSKMSMANTAGSWLSL